MATPIFGYLTAFHQVFLITSLKLYVKRTDTLLKLEAQLGLTILAIFTTHDSLTAGHGDFLRNPLRSCHVEIKELVRNEALIDTLVITTQ